ncbi:uncharacterized protein FOMMEDRAFT_161220 [Fomitiporia mediterranea MF3/22]|uniref:uncharacterized protein n=1 Tax=Fomitiporia mediterranea (strain MF3/22) TaxID=694068 RepID=UPI000440771F|nr:uncharacterized protein FOMMEDRAFT_161220 [Fomitiporia mediterranea MF3/22]EJC99007.1 hypothetical protein FOMMEDRAFT_161220 [Fomitiporia mediterranea MF3/22]
MSSRVDIKQRSLSVHNRNVARRPRFQSNNCSPHRHANRVHYPFTYFFVTAYMEYSVDLGLVIDSLYNLTVDHWERFQQSRERAELDSSISYSRTVLGLHPEGHPGCSEILDNLGNFLNVRFQQYGRLEDLEDAITVADCM